MSGRYSCAGAHTPPPTRAGPNLSPRVAGGTLTLDTVPPIGYTRGQVVSLCVVTTLIRLGGIIVATKYCSRCGYENDEERGACLMCYAPLPSEPADEGQAPELPEGVESPAGREAMAAIIAAAAGESLGAMESEELAPDYEMVSMDETGLGEFGEAEVPAAVVEAPVAEPEPAAEPAPPGMAMEEEAEEYAPPPLPPGAIDLQEEPLPAPTPEPIAEEEQAVAVPEAPETREPEEAPPPPPPPPGALELEEEAAEEADEERPTGDWSVGRQ